MAQSRWKSLAESVANVAVGYGVAVVTQVVVFPRFGLEADLFDNLVIGGIFTVVSLVRSYTLRRVFEALGSPCRKPSRRGIIEQVQCTHDSERERWEAE